MSNKEQSENLAEEAVDAPGDIEESKGEETSANIGDGAGENPAESLEKQLDEAQKEVVDLKDKMLRLAADYENYKKRNERERAIAMKYAGEHIFKEFLSVVDNLERAVSQGVVEGANAEQNLAGLLEGVELTLKSLYASLDKLEVKAIQSVGEPFDPNKQEALTMEPSDKVPANHVLAEFEKGYFYKDRLLRAAKVIVSSGKAND
ncbi:MAG: nucleotide exchange factor GrpE [Desulfopila sp.]|nr:nucleotide exchange factor GrpE [Desulfopila sp.]